jgi:8-oxo-dGTP pyrophosphatase MutT (NUDIX family)
MLVPSINALYKRGCAMLTKTQTTILLVQRVFIIDYGKTLVVQRRIDDQYNPGLWEAPGGKIDPDETPRVALMREVKEETGLDIATVDSIVHMCSRMITDGRYRGAPHITLFHIGKVIGGTLKMSSEHTRARWCTLMELLDLQLTPLTREAARSLVPRLFEHRLRA